MRMLISQSAGRRQVCFCVTRAMMAEASSAVKPALTRSSVSTPSKAAGELMPMSTRRLLGREAGAHQVVGLDAFKGRGRIDAHVDEAAREGGIEFVGLEQQRHGVAA